MKDRLDCSNLRHTAGRKNKDLLCCRMAKLGLDCGVIEHADRQVFDELKQRCAGCEFPDACADDLREDPSNPVWEAYCPNSARLTALTAS